MLASRFAARRGLGCTTAALAVGAHVPLHQLALHEQRRSCHDGAPPASNLSATRRVRRPVRKVSSEDDDPLDDATEALLHDDDREHAAREAIRLAAATVPPVIMRRMDDIDGAATASGRGTRRAKKEDDDGDDDLDDDVDPMIVSPPRPSLVQGPRAPLVDPTLAVRDPLLDAEEGAVDTSSGSVEGITDPLLQQQEQSTEDMQRTTDEATSNDDPLAQYQDLYRGVSMDPSQNACMTMPIAELVQLICAYQQSTENVRVVSEPEERMMYPALLQRIDECTIDMILDIVEQHWARSTLVRHGILFKDVARDRVASSAAELTAPQVLRCIIVMGMSAGRRKRDLDFFQMLGRLFMIHVNAYKSPTELVKVLTAFARAKIVPPPAFLGLIGRRLQVLCKSQPLPALPAYRALINLHKMGYDNMNAYRFLADRMLECIEENAKKEKTLQLVKARLAEEKRKIEAASGQASSTAAADAPSDATTSVVTDKEQSSSTNSTGAAGGDLVIEMTHAIAAKRRFALISDGLKPSHITKILLVLARFGAPHQQYLRPISKLLLQPHLAHLPPPAFTRTLRAMRIFRSTDIVLITAVLDHLVALGPANALLPDVLEALRMLSHPDVPVPPQSLAPFISLCAAIFGAQARLRAGDMCAVASDLMRIQRKDEIPLEAVEELCTLMDVFAERMTFLMELGVLALPHAEALEDMCKQMHHPDTKGKLQQLAAARRAILEREGGDDAYYSTLDIDVRETFHKAQIVNNWNTFGSYRPLPGVLQVDFQQALTQVSAECILHTAKLFELAYPGRMIAPLQRTMTKAFLAKLSAEGELVVSEDDPQLLTTRPNEELLFTRDTLRTFTDLLLGSPLLGVKRSADVWGLVLRKAKRLQLGDLELVAESSLKSLVGAQHV